MTSSTTTLFVLAGGTPKRFLASAHLRGAEVLIDAERADLAPLLRRLLERDFDEQIGFPARRIRCAQGSPEALRAAALFLAAAGFQVAIQSSVSQAISQAPARLSHYESSNTRAAIMFVAREQEQMADAQLWREVLEYRQAEAHRYGSLKEFRRQHRPRGKTVEVSMEQHQGGSLRDIDVIGVQLSETGARSLAPESSVKRLVEGAVIAEAGLQKMQHLGLSRGW